MSSIQNAALKNAHHEVDLARIELSMYRRRAKEQEIECVCRCRDMKDFINESELPTAQMKAILESHEKLLKVIRDYDTQTIQYLKQRVEKKVEELERLTKRQRG